MNFIDLFDSPDYYYFCFRNLILLLNQNFSVIIVKLSFIVTTKNIIIIRVIIIFRFNENLFILIKAFEEFEYLV